MAVILTEEDIAPSGGSARYWAYNGMDCCVPQEIRPIFAGRLQADPAAARIAAFELACQSPALAMMLRGAAIDEHDCTLAIRDWEVEEKRLTAEACATIGPLWPEAEKRKGKCRTDAKPHTWNNAVVYLRKHPENVGLGNEHAVCTKCGWSRLVARTFNPLSSPQVIKLCYELLGLPVQHSRKGERGVTADDEALDKLIHMPRTSEEHAGILRNILDVRGARKQIGFLKSRRSSDGRLRQSVNVGATETGRWSASKDPFREGTNFQNIADRSRNIIIADPGLILFYADLKSAESEIVAYDSEDDAYIEAHHSGDTHTFVASLVWPELGWTGDPGKDRAIADLPTPFDPAHSYRDYAKHVQHGGNIGQSAVGMARDAHIPVKQAEEVYERMYGQAFPDVRRRQREIMAQVATTGILVNPVGRKRQFFGRLWEKATQREGMAQTQQSTVADLLNLSLWRIWNELDTGVNVFNAPKPSDPNKVWLLAQVHDAILGLIRPHDITTLKRVMELMTIPIKIRGRVCTIPVEVSLGHNFRHFDPRKPETVGGIGPWSVSGDRIILHNQKENLKCV